MPETQEKKKARGSKYTKQACQEGAKYILMDCGRLGVRRALIIIGIVNLGWAIFVYAWFWTIEETPYPPLLGFTWTTQMRVTLMPEACVSLGLSAYMVYGAATRNTAALLVSILCQWLVVLGTFVFGFLYLINIGFTPGSFLGMIWVYFAGRVYILVLNMHFFYQLLGNDPWRRTESMLT